MAKLHQMDLAREATPYLKELVNQCNETVHLGVLEEGVVLKKLLSRQVKRYLND